MGLWLEQEGQLLLSQFDDVLTLPGGRMKVGEESLAAAQREAAEELGVALQNPVLFGLIENFFYDEKSGKDFHELLFVYRATIPYQESYQGTEVLNERLQWQRLGTIQRLQPTVLTQMNPDQPFWHLVEKD